MTPPLIADAPAVLRELRLMRPWTRFFAVGGFVYGLLFAVAFLLPDVTGVAQRRARIPFVRAVSVTTGLLGAGAYLAGAALLWRFSSAVRRAERRADAEGLEAGLVEAVAAHRAFWAFAGGVVTILVALSLLAFTAAIVISSLRNASRGGPVKETVVALRQVAGALEAYARRHHQYPVAPGIRELAQELEADAGVEPGSLPRADGWGRELVYVVPREEAGVSYRLWSRGEDGRFDGDAKPGGPVPGREERRRAQERSWRPAMDLLHADGSFVLAPRSLLEPEERAGRGP